MHIYINIIIHNIHTSYYSFIDMNSIYNSRMVWVAFSIPKEP